MRKVFVFATMLLLCASSSFAGDWEGYTKAGFMTWGERGTEGRTTETGPTQEIGIKHVANYEGAELTQSAGAWTSQLYYDGYKLDTGKPNQTVSGDVGLKLNLGYAVPVQLTDDISLATLAGIDGNAFFRIVPGELWLTAAVRTGLALSYKTATLKAGILYPFYAQNTAYLQSVGINQSVTAHPKGEISPFVEMFAKFSDRWTVGVYFESWRFSASESVPYTFSGSTASMLSKSNSMYQPDTLVTFSGMNLTYNF